MLSEGARQTQQRKCAFLIRQANKHDRHHKKSKGQGSQHFPTEGTENIQHGGAFSLIYTLSGTPSSTAGEEREAARTCSGKKQKFTAMTERKRTLNSQASSNPVPEIPVLGDRCCWVLMAPRGEGVRRSGVDNTDARNPVKGKQQQGNLFLHCQHPHVLIP